MAVPNLDRRNLAFHLERVEALQEDTPARWGGMSAAAMVVHVRAVVEVSLGELEVPAFGFASHRASVWVFRLPCVQADSPRQGGDDPADSGALSGPRGPV